MRIIAPDFVATFETADGVVRRADSAIAYLVGWTDDEVRELAYSKSWHAAIIFGGPIRVIHHWESFEVLRDGERKNARERAFDIARHDAPAGSLAAIRTGPDRRHLPGVSEPKPKAVAARPRPSLSDRLSVRA